MPGLHQDRRSEGATMTASSKAVNDPVLAMAPKEIQGGR